MLEAAGMNTGLKRAFPPIIGADPWLLILGKERLWDLVGA
jgi:hypothetical protein